jgi:Right handed beta helix region
MQWIMHLARIALSLAFSSVTLMVAADEPRGQGASGLPRGTSLSVERATPEQIGLLLTVDQTMPRDMRVAVRYRGAAKDTEWRAALPLLRIHPEWVAPGAPQPPVESFAGTIFDLTPGAAYDVELSFSHPGEPVQTKVVRSSTRPLPATSRHATATAKPGDDLNAMIRMLGPGSVLEIANGVYDLPGLVIAVSGTESKPIVIRGASRKGAILRVRQDRIIQLHAAANVVIENMTLVGSRQDSGTTASSIGVAFWDGALQENITIRGLDIRGVDQGIIASGTTRGILVYDNDLRGNNVWTQPFVESNLTWNDDGIRLGGEGNCAFQNTLYGFGDAFSVAGSVHSAGVYYYRNRIEMTGDDAFEADYSTRNIAFYDNNITNASTFLSLDPLWGGPLYAFRNVVTNTVRGPFKLNATNSGFLIYNNTLIRTNGTTEWGWVQFNNGPLRNWAYQNNIFIYHGGTGQQLAIESSNNDPIDFTHNAWFPDGTIWWTTSGGSFKSLAGAFIGLPATEPVFGASTNRHEGDIALREEPFAQPIALGTDHLTEVTGTPIPALRPGAPPVGAGIVVPNVTDGYAGRAPDMGAIIAGRASPTWGASRP